MTPEAKAIAQLFVDYGVTGVIWVSPNIDAGGHVIYIEVQIDRRGRQIPSNYMIATAEKAAIDAYGAIDVVVSRGDVDDAMLSIKSMLMRRHLDTVRNVYCHLDGSGVTVWVEPKASLSHEQIGGLTEEIEAAINSFDLNLKAVISTSNVRLPNDSVILSMIRRAAPVKADDIATIMVERGFELPEDDWLARRLDRLRKRGFVVRFRDGQYALTRESLLALGSGKNRSSPDIRRILDLARDVE